MEMHIGLSEEQRQALAGALQKWLADTYFLYLKTQNFHWNITGPEFYSLHILFEKHYEDMADAVDEIAERIRALGFFAEGTTEAFKKINSIKEDDRVLSKKEMLSQLIEGHEAVIRDARALGDLAADFSDHGTSDLIGRRLVFHEKALWMLTSSL